MKKKTKMRNKTGILYLLFNYYTIKPKKKHFKLIYSAALVRGFLVILRKFTLINVIFG